jgi:hypothetical protein
MYERKVSVTIRSVLDMAVAVLSASDTGQISDPQVAWFDNVLACLAAGVAECAGSGDSLDVPDAVRIDRIARLEKIKAAAAALLMAHRSGLLSLRRRCSWPRMCIRTRSAAG